MSDQSYMPDPHYRQADEPTEPVAYPQQQQQPYNNNVAQPVQPVNQGYTPNQANYVAPTSGQVERREEVYDDSEQRRANTRYWLASVLEIGLALRFIFRLLGANESNGFVAGLYNFSYAFVAPFRGIFTDPSLGYGHYLEVSTIVAMLIYALIAWGLVALSRVVLGPSLTSRRSVTMETHSGGVFL